MSGVSTPQANRFFATPFSFEELEPDISTDNTDADFNCDVDTDDFVADTDVEGVWSGFDQANGFFDIASAVKIPGSADVGTDCLDADGNFAAAATWRDESGLLQANCLFALSCVFNVGESVVLFWCAFDMEDLKFLS